jgi:hypothetical protein
LVVGTQAETIAYWPALELLRTAGADEERAAAKAAWLRIQAEDSPGADGSDARFSAKNGARSGNW